MADHSNGNPGVNGGGAGRWIFWGFVLVAAYCLSTEHRAHTIQYLPFLLLLACPLMHLFHGHGGHGRQVEGDATDGKKPSQQSPDSRRDSSGGHHH